MMATSPGTMRFRIPAEIIAADLVDESVLLDMRSKKYFRLNRTASMIWRAIGDGATLAGILDAICERFDIDRDAAHAELQTVCNDLLERGLITYSALTSGVDIA
jgi:hypothetical protein